jgi:hypothetical protein
VNTFRVKVFYSNVSGTHENEITVVNVKGVMEAISFALDTFSTLAEEMSIHYLSARRVESDKRPVGLKVTT